MASNQMNTWKVSFETGLLAEEEARRDICHHSRSYWGCETDPCTCCCNCGAVLIPWRPRKTTTIRRKASTWLKWTLILLSSCCCCYWGRQSAWRVVIRTDKMEILAVNAAAAAAAADYVSSVEERKGNKWVTVCWLSVKKKREIYCIHVWVMASAQWYHWHGNTCLFCEFTLLARYCCGTVSPKVGNQDRSQWHEANWTHGKGKRLHVEVYLSYLNAIEIWHGVHSTNTNNSCITLQVISGYSSHIIYGYLGD